MSTLVPALEVLVFLVIPCPFAGRIQHLLFCSKIPLYSMYCSMNLGTQPFFINQVPLEGSLPVRCELLLRALLCWASGEMGDPYRGDPYGDPWSLRALGYHFGHMNGGSPSHNYQFVHAIAPFPTFSTSKSLYQTIINHPHFGAYVLLTYPDEQNGVLKLASNSWKDISMNFPSLGPKRPILSKFTLKAEHILLSWGLLYFKPSREWWGSLNRPDV